MKEKHTCFCWSLGNRSKFWIFLLCTGIAIFSMQTVYKDQILSRTPSAAEPLPIRLTIPVDLVYTWVNGSDPKHQDILRRMIDVLLKNHSLTATRARNLGTHRFADNDALRYSLRSVEKHADWIRHIFIVTNGQVPGWLNLRNSKVTIVNHEDIFDDPDDLPTFSSHSIEHNIYKINGLSEGFIYMNDDFFFGQNVSLEDFYTEDAGTKVVFSTWTASTVCGGKCSANLIRNGVCDTTCNYDHCAWDGGDCDEIPERLRPKDDGTSHCDYTTSIFFTNALYNRVFGARIRKVPAHTPLFIKKTVFQDFVKRFPNEIKATTKNKIRSPLDFQFEFSYVYFQMEGQSSARFKAFYSSSLYSFVMLFANEDKARKDLDMLRKTKKKFICLNDDIDYKKTREAQVTVRLLHEFYEAMFPKRSSFEIVD
ncbi:N-acetylglucosamine-1-phosphotransferase subunits alpha/beta-like [Ruditapes philippinarum]|uniref:N-acetylglucosamine-1-phosphotransferase subunits alpha/beta-like n=1 Tax=Ruditapes philippinarum TaxID=129788 RepID=UPI00295BA094|nr:N-acetylglucosamine-1-phosphotransferase subunits alpha/beta-like [Ruditapes philippinarum]